MATSERQRWEELYKTYEDLPADAKKIASKIFYVEYHKKRPKMSELGKQTLALEIGLAAATKIIHAMDGSQEYEDTLAGQEIFEALKEG